MLHPPPAPSHANVLLGPSSQHTVVPWFLLWHMPLLGLPHRHNVQQSKGIPESPTASLQLSLGPWPCKLAPCIQCYLPTSTHIWVLTVVPRQTSRADQETASSSKWHSQSNSWGLLHSPMWTPPPASIHSPYGFVADYAHTEYSNQTVQGC